MAMDVSVQLDFKGKVVTTYPEYKNGWKVKAFADGSLQSLEGNQKYAYLFWAGEISFPDAHYLYKNGFCIEGTQSIEFLENTLANIGLNTEEANDFIVYWLPMMQKNKYNIVHFWVDDNYDNSTFLTIQPKPQSELRLYMEFKSSAIPVAIAPQQFKTFIRKGFAVVEWGGADLDINKTKVQ